MSNPKERLKSNNKQRVVPGNLAGPDYFNYLNDDCLLKIFKYLSFKQRLDVGTVCKRWRDASQLAMGDIKALNFKNAAPWKGDPEELPSSYRTNKSIARILKNCGASLRQLHLGDHIDSTILRVIGQDCCNLTELEAEASNGDRGRAKLSLLMRQTPKHLKIFEELTELTALTLKGFSLEPEILRAISQKIELTHLSLAKCSMKINGFSLTLLKNLEYLNLGSVKSASDNLVIQISKNCKKLKYLNLSYTIGITSRGINRIADISQLEELSLHSASNFFTVRPLSALHHLRKLDIGRCYRLPENEITEIIESAHNLEYLNWLRTYQRISKAFIVRVALIVDNRSNNIELNLIVSDNITLIFS